MPRLGASAMVAAFVLGGAGARAAPVPLELPPAIVLANYENALAKRPRPKFIAFEFAISQLGLHDMEQSHRAYRSGSNERDEILIVDGRALEPPAVRIITKHAYRYDIAAVAPKRGAYVFSYAGAVRSGPSYTYVFRTDSRAKAAFAVSEIEIDGRTFLPAIVRFRIAGDGARGGGSLQYGRSDLYWVIREANVSALLKGGTMARERIVWTKYRFPSSLPRSTFEAPQPRATRAPSLPLAVPVLAAPGLQSGAAGAPALP